MYSGKEHHAAILPRTDAESVAYLKSHDRGSDSLQFGMQIIATHLALCHANLDHAHAIAYRIDKASCSSAANNGGGRVYII